MPDAGVSYEVSGAIGRIALDRPPVNALNLEAIRAVVVALRRAAADADVRAVVVTSAIAGRFCAGLDLNLLIGASSDQVRALLRELYVELYACQCALGKPSIAAVNGATRGGGMTLAISCDVIVAARRATFGYPEINIGVLPAIHFVHLPRIVGRHRAFELLFGGRSFGAEEALGLGLVSRIVADADLDAAAMTLAAEFAAKSPAVMRLGKAAFMRQNDDRSRIADAVEDFCTVVGTDAAQEGIRAFLEGRRPDW